MKGFAFVLLCVVAIVQGRSTGVQTSNAALAALGENPWLVHLRIAVSTSGYLNSCVGSLIDQSWVLTSANCVQDARFIWIRYGVVVVINPELVTETSAVRLHPDYEQSPLENNVALISINRNVLSTANIAPVALATADFEVPESARLCGFGAEEDGSAGERLSCYSVTLEQSDDTILAKSEDGAATEYDIGAPLVSDGVQFGILVEAKDEGASFVNPARFLDWIEETAGINSAPDEDGDDGEDEDEDADEEADADPVQIVN